jgi:bisphosphoglycerate-dependent phosphoglycerate mutase
MRSKHESDLGTRVILVRHGQSTYNALGLYQGSSDESVLTELGRSDARLTGNFLKGVVFDAVYSSSLKRAQETAREILRGRSHNCDPRSIAVTDKLRETDLPAWQGLAFQYVRETFPEEYGSPWKCRGTRRQGDKGTREQGNNGEFTTHDSRLTTHSAKILSHPRLISKGTRILARSFTVPQGTNSVNCEPRRDKSRLD